MGEWINKLMSKDKNKLLETWKDKLNTDIYCKIIFFCLFGRALNDGYTDGTVRMEPILCEQKVFLKVQGETVPRAYSLSNWQSPWPERMEVKGSNGVSLSPFPSPF